MRLFQFFPAALAALLLAACGGTPAPATVSNMVVTPAKGICYGCTVSVYSATGTWIATGTTSITTGKATLDTAGNTSLLLVKVTGNTTAQVWDEGANVGVGALVSYPATESMTSVVSSFTSGGAVGVTPLTTIAARFAGVDTDNLGKPAYVAKTITAANIVEAGARTLLLLGLPSDFPLFAAPVPASSADTSSLDLAGKLIAELGKKATGTGGALAYFKSLAAEVSVSTFSAHLTARPPLSIQSSTGTV